jgi:hypothetical protein
MRGWDAAASGLLGHRCRRSYKRWGARPVRRRQSCRSAVTPEQRGRAPGDQSQPRPLATQRGVRKGSRDRTAAAFADTQLSNTPATRHRPVVVTPRSRRAIGDRAAAGGTAMSRRPAHGRGARRQPTVPVITLLRTMLPPSRAGTCPRDRGLSGRWGPGGAVAWQVEGPQTCHLALHTLCPHRHTEGSKWE